MTLKTNAKKGRTARTEVDRSTASEAQNTFTTPAASRYLGVSAATLRFWRANGGGPRFYRAGDRLIRYRRVDCDAWIEARLSK
jgi:predicted DNA-binding transcriptional regulator AlpA